MSASPSAPKTGAVKTVVKALALIDLVSAAPDGLSLADLVSKSGVPKPTAHRILAVLVDEGYLRFIDDTRYGLGSELLVLGSAYLDSLDLRREAADILRQLVAATDEVSHLGVLDEHRVVYIDKVEAPHGLRMHSRVGGTQPAHATGLGKAILAHSATDAVNTVIEAGLYPQTDRTITDPDTFLQELRAVRRRGYAVDDVENEEGIRCVAAPILDHRGTVLAGLSVAGPDYRLTTDDVTRVASVLRQHALALSRRFGYRGTLPRRH